MVTWIMHTVFLRNYITLECYSDTDCTGISDTCKANACFCGSTDKCSEIAGTCILGKCKCGENEGCSEHEICSAGECQGILFFIFIIS